MSAHSGENSHRPMNLTLHVWRQASKDAEGKMTRYDVKDVSSHMSFLEMLDVVNERLLADGKEPIAFDSDYQYVAAWEFSGDVSKPTLHKESLEFEYVKPVQRSYK